ncbi:MAG: hypothetical protein ACOYXC_20095 [Candidatus Rifleibacteriota bacterium]
MRLIHSVLCFLLILAPVSSQEKVEIKSDKIAALHAMEAVSKIAAEVAVPGEATLLDLNFQNQYEQNGVTHKVCRIRMIVAQKALSGLIGKILAGEASGFPAVFCNEIYCEGDHSYQTELNMPIQLEIALNLKIAAPLSAVEKDRNAKIICFFEHFLKRLPIRGWREVEKSGAPAWASNLRINQDGSFSASCICLDSSVVFQLGKFLLESKAVNDFQVNGINRVYNSQENHFRAEIAGRIL